MKYKIGDRVEFKVSNLTTLGTVEDCVEGNAPAYRVKSDKGNMFFRYETEIEMVSPS